MNYEPNNNDEGILRWPTIWLSAEQFKTARCLANSGFDWLDVARFLSVDSAPFFAQWSLIFWTLDQLNQIAVEALREIKRGIKKEREQLKGDEA